jgi:hypothetical protein
MKDPKSHALERLFVSAFVQSPLEPLQALFQKLDPSFLGKLRSRQFLLRLFRPVELFLQVGDDLLHPVDPYEENLLVLVPRRHVDLPL